MDRQITNCLIEKFFKSSNIDRSKVDWNSFHELLYHLNPAVEGFEMNNNDYGFDTTRDIKQEEDFAFFEKVKEELLDEEDLQLLATLPVPKPASATSTSQPLKLPQQSSLFRPSWSVPRLPATKFRKGFPMVTQEKDEEQDMDFGAKVEHRPVGPSRRRAPYYVYSKTDNRLCDVCNHIEEPKNMTGVRKSSEKLIIVLGAMRRKEMTIVEARASFKKHTFYMCSLHFAEACDEIFRMLHVKTADEIAVVPHDVITNALMIVNSIRESHMTPSDLRKMLTVFVKEHYKAAIEVPTFVPEKKEETKPVIVKTERIDVHEAAPAPRPVGRPRKYPIGVTKCVRKSFLAEQEKIKKENALAAQQSQTLS